MGAAPFNRLDRLSRVLHALNVALGCTGRASPSSGLARFVRGRSSMVAYQPKLYGNEPQ